MTSSVQQIYWNALLADATYALDRSLENLQGSDLVTVLKSRMTEPVASYIASKFSMVTHIETNDVQGSGFDATVWRRSDGKLYVSMQGTAGFQDFLTDAKLTVTGNAGQQIIDMSSERAVLVSIAYQGLVPARSAALKAAIVDDSNRAAAWYLIRYKGYMGATDGPGQSKRHYAESQTFGLYGDASNVGADESKQVFSMLAKNRDAILAYEAKFGVSPDRLTSDTAAGGIAGANADYHLTGADQVQTLTAALKPARNAFIAWLNTQLPTGEPPLVAADWNPAAIAYNNPLSPQPILDGRSLDGKGNGMDKNLLVGNDTPDYLIGGAGADLLIGGKGDDFLQGGAGDDTMYGGEGDDTYVIDLRQGVQHDRIVDSDNRGHIVVIDANGNALNTINLGRQGTSNTWTDSSGQVTISHNSPWKVTLSDGSVIELGESFSPVGFGITLQDEVALANHTFVGDFTKQTEPGDPTRYVRDAGGNYVSAGAEANAADVITGSAGADRISGLGGNDALAGMAGDDWITGGGGDDQLYAGSYQTLADALAAQSSIATNTSTELLDGGAGNDQVIGGAGDDALFGGDGNDTLVGGAGRDVVFSDGDAGWGFKSDTPASNRWVEGANAAGQTVYFGGAAYIGQVSGRPSGNPNGAFVENHYRSGSFGPESTDFGAVGGLAGYSVASDPAYAGVVDPVFDGVDTEASHRAQDPSMVTSFDTNRWAGSDVVYAGAGDDLVNAGGGNDFVDAGSGNDVVAGYAGNDVLYGQEGDDLLLGDYFAIPGATTQPVFGTATKRLWLDASLHGNDFVDGGAGNDTATGYGSSEAASNDSHFRLRSAA